MSRALDISRQLYDAWQAGDRSAAGRVAAASVVSKLFGRAVVRGMIPDSACSGGVGNYLCNYSDPNSYFVVQMYVAHERGTPMVVRGLHLVA